MPAGDRSARSGAWQEQAAEIVDAGLFDAAYYVEQVGAEALEGCDPLAHYVQRGASLGADPHPLFDTAWYRDRNPDVVAAAIDPFLHFLRFGFAERRNPHPLVDLRWAIERDPDAWRGARHPLHAFTERRGAVWTAPNPLFDPAWYLSRYPEVSASGRHPLVHYIRVGERAGHRPNPVFDPCWYRSEHPDIAERGGAALAHYVAIGAREGAAPSPLFDPAWYCASTGGRVPLAEALADYLANGGRRGADAHPLFATSWYLARHPDAARAGADALAHYLDGGAAAGCPPHPLFDADAYLTANPDVAAAVERGDLDPLSHFLAWGARENRRPHPLFDVAWYRARHPAVLATRVNPLVHYVREGAARDLPPNPVFHPAWYRARHPGCRDGIHTLLHHAAHRGEPGFEPNPLFERYARHFAPAPEWPVFADERANPLGAYFAGRPAACFGEPPELAFPQVESPVATVIVPAYDQPLYTLACLRSLAAAANRTPCEVLLLDDASPETHYPTLLRDVPGLRVVRNETNCGFIGSCNRGGDEARGRILVFLNNDVVVLDGWLDALIASFEQLPDVGIVGARLFFPSGLVAESGCIVWNDGSAWNYGRRHAPDSPETTYARDADYVSGAALAIERDFFRELGGFDTAFAPAYYEDTDLAYRVRRAGRRVFVQPRSAVIHFEGVSSLQDPSSGMKANQARNREIFRARWSDAIAAHGAPGVEPDVEKDRAYRGRSLFLDTATPEPGRDARSLRLLQAMRARVAAGDHVTFVPANGLAPEPARSVLGAHGIRVLPRPWLASIEQLLSERDDRYDLVWVSRPALARRWLARLRARWPDAALVFDAADLLSASERRAVVSPCGDAGELAPLLAIADVTLVAASPTQWESDTANGVRASVHNLPWIYAAPVAARSAPGRPDVVVVTALEGAAAADALAWLARAVLPPLARRVAGLRVFVPPRWRAVTHLHPSLRALDAEALANPASWDDMRVAVAPSHFGSGLAGRLQLALARGVPCVASDVAASDLPEPVRSASGVCIAGDADAFVEAIARLLLEDPTWARASEAARAAVAAVYSYESARRRIDEILAGISRHDAGAT